MEELLPERRNAHSAECASLGGAAFLALIGLVAGFFEGIAKDRQSVESTLLVNALCDTANRVVVPVEPSGVGFQMPALLIRKSNLRSRNSANMASISDGEPRSARTSGTGRPISAATASARPAPLCRRA